MVDEPVTLTFTDSMGNTPPTLSFVLSKLPASVYMVFSILWGSRGIVEKNS